MAKKTSKTEKEVAQNNAVINPYALAEVITGRKINWKETPDVPALLESIFQTPYEELFDPRFGGPLYLGLKLDKSLQLKLVRSPLLDISPSKEERNDNNHQLEQSLLDATTLRELCQKLANEKSEDFEIKETSELKPGLIQIILRTPEKTRLQTLSRVFTKDIISTVSPDPKESGKAKDWTPPNGTWSDPGQFFNEAAEFFDPIQGSVANCYYIAALSAVAWAMPYHIRHLTRATGTMNQRFTNMIRFYKVDSGGKIDKEIEVTDTVPLNSSSGNFIYCRSSEDGEIWPAIYEKAYAKFKTGISGDHPDITATAWGDCVRATAELTGGTRTYYENSNFSADELWSLVRSNSRGGRTFNPMTAWTYSSGTASKKKIVYGDANIVASHCYTILGWAYRNRRKYIILRNPWGNTEAGVQTLDATIFLYDISWWRPISLTVVDGTFALEAEAFKAYFAGMGVVKGPFPVA